MPAKPRDFEPLPYYRWYWRDYRSSRTVQRMHYVARGIYRELLDECWAKGCIPDDVAKLAEMCGCPTSVMATHWSNLKQMFKFVGDGLYINERMENERTESDKVRAARAVAGRRGGESRKQTQANAGKSEQTPAESSTLLSSSSSSSSSSAEQSKSSSASLPDESPSSAPVAALGPEGPRAPVARSSGVTPIGATVEKFGAEWRAAMTPTKAVQ